MRPKMTHMFLLLFSPLTVFCQTAQINSPTPTVPFNSNANYAYGIMPTNLPSAGTYTKSQDAANAYATWVTNYVRSCGGSPVQYRVLFDDGSSTVSEGIGYGMLLAAYAGDQVMFNGLWNYYKANMDANGLMHWHISGCSGIAGSMAASDADEDAAMALVVAACQWPSVTSYATDATTLITAIKNCEIDIKSAPINQMSNGDGWIVCNTGTGNSCRNPGYMAPAYYKYFGSYVPSQATIWNSCTTASYTLINNNRDATTGLVSNWSNQNGGANNCNGGSVEYGYDACRSPWRMATDVIWYNDANASAICNKIGTYVIGKTAASVGGPVPQSGGTGTHNATFVSTFAAGIVGATPASTYQTIMNQMYSQTVATTDATPAYFGNTLRAISLFMMTGNFWKPCPTSLPIENFIFKGIIENASVKLLWSTGFEEKSDYFEIQKSLDGKNYFNIGTVKSDNMNSSSYYFLDSAPLAPISYYRIVQFEKDGNYDISETICIQQSASYISVSPNPFESEIRLTIFPAPIGEVGIKVLDISGKLLYEIEEEYNNEIVIDEKFSEGVYFIHVTTADKAYVVKAMQN